MWLYVPVCVCVCRQQDLFRVLKAYTLYSPDEGYCQAQAPIAAVLLMHMPAEVSLNSHTIYLYIYKSYIHTCRFIKARK